MANYKKPGKVNNQQWIELNRNLFSLTEQVSKQFFNRPFNSTVEFNNRLRTAGGRCFVHEPNAPLEINFKVSANQELLVGVIKHELCHHFLAIDGFEDTGHGAKFQAMLQQVGGLNSEVATKLYKKSVIAKQPKKPAKKVRYFCLVCKRTFVGGVGFDGTDCPNKNCNGTLFKASGKGLIG